MYLPNTVILVRNGETLWGQQGKLLGRRDMGITADGIRQAGHALDLLRDVKIAEILASPQARAIETAEAFAQHFKLGIGRDPRLSDLDVGPWEGTPWTDLRRNEDFAPLLNGAATHFPGGEELQAARDRAVASVEEAAVDNPDGASILMVTHSAIIRLVLTHYLGMLPGGFVWFQLNCGSLTVLRFTDDATAATVLGVNLAVPLAQLLQESDPQ